MRKRNGTQENKPSRGSVRDGLVFSGDQCAKTSLMHTVGQETRMAKSMFPTIQKGQNKELSE
jgi:hypothetical protein